MEEQSWSEISVSVKTEDIETAGNIANMVVPYGIYIEDYSALEEETRQIAHIDLIEEELLKKDKTRAIIHVYVNPHENPLEAVSFIKERLEAQKIENEIKISDCKTEDWVNNWKQYFHPMPIGKKLLIKPTWESCEEYENRKILHIEPGLAFGTGSHPTTRLCLETLENYVGEKSTVLDIGCGSGILSIACLLLGAKSAAGVDIDSLAVKTAKENGAENGFSEPRFCVFQGNLSDCVNGKYNIIVANIVADIIMELNKEAGSLLADGGVYITGGIIDARGDEVLCSFSQNGFEVIERKEEKGWLVFVCKKIK